MLSFRARHLKGFSLIEMSLVLAIMGTIAGLSMPMLLGQKSVQKQQQTTKAIEVVMTALGTYAAANEHLPCPASKSSGGVAGTCSANSTTAAVGFVPYKSLGLSEKSAQDGLGHPLRYAIDPTLSNKEDFKQNAEQNLFITDEKGKSVLDSPKKQDRLALVVIAEGAAYQQTLGEFESTNTSSSLSFVDAPFSTQKNSPFRHQVKWSTRNNLLTYYGKSAPIIKGSSSEPQPPAANTPGAGTEASATPGNTQTQAAQSTPPHSPYDLGYTP